MGAVITSTGAVVTFLESGTARFSFGKGKTAQELLVHAGEVMEIDQVTKIEGVDVHITPPKQRRTIAKRAHRPQKLRTCDFSFAQLELPDVGDQSLKDLETKLNERGALLRAKLAGEAKRLTESN